MRNPRLLIALLVILPILVFGQVAGHQFLNYDDAQFVTENEYVRGGLCAEGFGWAIASASIGYYPLTWLSHMLDVELFGLNAGAHLLSALLLHILSTLALFFALRQLTGATVRSAFVAALFAIHPMHVESVAWVSERKDTLSTFFGMLALVAYAYRREKQWLVAAALAASLLSKQMLITLPFLLLILDWWPLRRLNMTAVKEKIPLFVLTILGAIVAVIGQRNLNAVQTAEALPLGDRLANAAVAYVKYLGKLVWPADMAVVYPMTEVSTGAALGALALLGAISAAAWTLRKRAPYLLAGWLWYLGTLVPVIGIIQIGAQSMADRYTYFPYIGLFIAVVWGLHDLLPRPAMAYAGAAVVALLAILAWRQTSYWQSTETLFEHTLAVTGPNPVAEYSLGQELQASDPDRAIPHLRRVIELADAALRANPRAPRPETYPQAHVAIGTALLTKARNAKTQAEQLALITAARTEYETALRLDPNAPHAARNIEIADQMKAALAAPATTAAAPAPADDKKKQLDAFLDAGTAESQQGHREHAIEQFRKAVALAPESVEAHVYLALGLGQAQQFAAAAQQLREAKRLDANAANNFVTKAMRLEAAPDNIDRLIASLEQQAAGAR
jgi:tetratricopeptide (TPR) repeat protein